jgi:hypothetical protein
MWWFRGPSYFWGAVLVVVGVLALLGNFHLLDNLNWNYVWPVFLIALGAWLIVARGLPGGGDTIVGGRAADRSDPREGLERATLDIAVGTARVEIRGAALGDQLYHAKIGHSGQAPEVDLDRATGTLRIAQHGSWMMGGWGRVDLEIQLSDAIPWEIHAKTGTIKGTIDLSTARLSRLESDAGASRIELSVPKPAGEVPIRMEGGSVRLRLRRPSGTAMRLEASGGSVHLTADGVRQRGLGNLVWQSPGLESATDRYSARFSGGSVHADIEAV